MPDKILYALQYEKAIDVFEDVIDNEFEGGKILDLFWGAYSANSTPPRRRLPHPWNHDKGSLPNVPPHYLRFPGRHLGRHLMRLADPVFERIIEWRKERERLLEAMKNR